MTETSLSAPELLQELIDTCLKAGASAADARLGQSEGVSVAVRDGKLETIEREESSGIALRCLFGQRQASVSGTDVSPASLISLAERCVAMAKAAPEDPYCGLAPEGDLLSSGRDIDLSGDEEPPASSLEADALAAEAAALAVPGIKTLAGCGANWSRTQRWVAASNGFFSMKSGASSGLGLAAIAEREGVMERDYESRSTRFRTDRPAPEAIGKTAAERAVARLGARKLDSQTAHVIYDQRVADSLLGAFMSAISGPSVARGVSFLKDRLGKEVFNRHVCIIDDPTLKHGMGSRVHDGEGRAVSPTHFIDDGRLTAWLLNGPSAKQLGLSPNGFAGLGFGDPPGVSTSNLYMAAGDRTPAELMQDVDKGLLVTDMFGPSINPNTGDYSVGVAGFWFEEGEIAFPVSEVTIAGDLPSMFARLIPASDLEFHGSRDAPSVLIENMSLAGA